MLNIRRVTETCNNQGRIFGDEEAYRFWLLYEVLHFQYRLSNLKTNPDH